MYGDAPAAKRAAFAVARHAALFRLAARSVAKGDAAPQQRQSRRPVCHHHGLSRFAAEAVARIGKGAQADLLFPQYQDAAQAPRRHARLPRQCPDKAHGQRPEADARRRQHPRRQSAEGVHQPRFPRRGHIRGKQRRQHARKRRHIAEKCQRAKDIRPLAAELCRRQGQQRRHGVFDEEVEGRRNGNIQPQQRVTYRQHRARQCRAGDAQRLRLPADGAHRTVQERRVRAEIIQQQKIDIDDHGTPPFRSPFGK